MHRRIYKDGAYDSKRCALLGYDPIGVSEDTIGNLLLASLGGGGHLGYANNSPSLSTVTFRSQIGDTVVLSSEWISKESNIS